MDRLPGLGCHADRQRGKVGLIGRHAVKARMRAASVKEWQGRGLIPTEDGAHGADGSHVWLILNEITSIAEHPVLHDTFKAPMHSGARARVGITTAKPCVCRTNSEATRHGHELNVARCELIADQRQRQICSGS